MNARRLAAALLVALIASASPSLADGGRESDVAGPGFGSDGFADVRPGVPLVFPEDHGPHPDYRIEWWYLTANLETADGRPLGVQWTLFRTARAPGEAEGWDSPQFWMGHAALTTAETHRFHEVIARGGIGQAGVTAEPFAAWIDDWEMRAAEGPVGDRLAPLDLRAAAPDFSYHLRLEADRPVALQGEAGYSQKSEQGQASYYYSQPFYAVSGAVTLDGEEIAVTGRAWLDREWSSEGLDPNQWGWDWFSLHLGTGEKVMLFRLRRADGVHEFAGNWITQDGRSTPLPVDGIEAAPRDRARVDGRDIPVGWTVSIPSRGLEIETTPLNRQAWMATSTGYWEGPIRFSGSHDGLGYLEMTGYLRTP